MKEETNWGAGWAGDVQPRFGRPHEYIGGPCDGEEAQLPQAIPRRVLRQGYWYRFNFNTGDYEVER